MEDPFTVLSALVPDPPTKPYLTPLYPPGPTPSYNPSQSQTPQPGTTYPLPVIIPSNRPLPTLSEISNSNSRRHWTINRNAPARNKGKDKEDLYEQDDDVDVPAWKLPRDPHTLDFGSFAALAGELAEEMKRRGISVGFEGEEENIILDVIRESLDCECEVPGAETAAEESSLSGTPPTEEYWSAQRAMEAEDYLRDVVYGGVDGFAYVRSLAEFVTPESPKVLSIFLASAKLISFYQAASSSAVPADEPPSEHPGLGMPLAKWVASHVVDPLTDGRHSLLQEASTQLLWSVRGGPSAPSAQFDEDDAYKRSQKITAQIFKSLHVYPASTQNLSTLLQLRTHKIDMGTLIKTPQELFLSEEEWAGKIFRDRRASTLPPAEARSANEAVGVQQLHNGPKGVEGPEELNQVLDYAAGIISVLDRRIRERSDSKAEEQLCVKLEENVDPDPSTPSAIDAEDPVLRNLRLNLLALAKRAPLDTIARLPKDLVPEHIRRFVPTLET